MGARPVQTARGGRDAARGKPGPGERFVLWGKAVRTLRELAELTQDQAAEGYGTTQQNWARIEAGQNPSAFNIENLDRLTGAVRATPQNLLDAFGHVTQQPFSLGGPGEGVAEADYRRPVVGRVRAGQRAPFFYDAAEPDSELDFAWLFGPTSGTLQVFGDSVTGLAESGEYVAYDRTRRPAKGQLCVVDVGDAELYLKVFQRIEGGRLVVSQTLPNDELTFELADVRGLYAVRLKVMVP